MLPREVASWVSDWGSTLGKNPWGGLSEVKELPVAKVGFEFFIWQRPECHS